MSSKSIFTNLVRAGDGTYTAAYGSFILQSALQPIFRQYQDGILDIVAFEGLARPNRDGMPFSPAQFFPLVAPEDMPMIDSLLRTLHILNVGMLNRTNVRVCVNFETGLYRTLQDMRHEVERIRLATHEAGMTPDQIICEVSERGHDEAHQMRPFINLLRDTGFLIAIDDYGGDNSDIDWIKTLKPEYLRFEARWVRDFMGDSAGFALLKVLVRQFKDDGMQPIFGSLEELWQVDICRELGVPLLQGYALASPELAPTTFNMRFPQMLSRGRPYSAIAPDEDAPDDHNHGVSHPREYRTPRQQRVFGRKGL